MTTTGCGGTGDHNRAVYSTRDVRRAFADEGVQLRFSRRAMRGRLFVAASAGVGEFSVLVLPKEVPPDGLNLTVAASWRVASVRNVIVGFDPAGPDASRVHAALARLRSS
jgi:hypothetical protein